MANLPSQIRVKYVIYCCVYSLWLAQPGYMLDLLHHSRAIYHSICYCAPVTHFIQVIGMYMYHSVILLIRYEILYH